MEYDFFSVPNDPKKKSEVLNLFKPNFSITINPKGDIQKIPRAILDIEHDFIELRHINTSKNLSHSAKNRSDAILESKGITKANIELSKQIMKIINIGVKNDINYENSNKSNNKSETFNYVNTSYYPKLSVTLSPTNIQLNPDIINRFKSIISLDNEKAKRKKLYETYNLYGMYIPIQFILGGRYNIFIEAKNEDENIQKLQDFKNKTNFFISEQKIDFQYNNNQINKINNTNENIRANVEIEGGTINPKNIEEWKRSFNLHNIEIIEYLNLEKIYKFCGDDNISEQIEKLEENIIIEQEMINKEREQQLIDNMKELEITIGILIENESKRENLMKAFKYIYSNSSKKSKDRLLITKILKLSDENIKVNVKIVNIMDNYFIKKCDGFILAPNITDKNSLDVIADYAKMINNNTKEDNPILLIAKKSHFKNGLSENDLIQACNKFKIKSYIENSKSLENDNFKNNIESLIQSCSDIVHNKQDKTGNVYQLENSNKESKRFCF